MHRALFSLSALAWLSPVAAADKPEQGPVPAWVEAVPLPADASPSGDAPIEFVLTDWQVNFSGAESEAYFHSLVRVQTSEGLTSIGTISLPWNPATDTLTVHHLQILRGASVVDVLAGGQSFTVLRRENSLEYAALNGILTAVIQPAGLQVGDRIDLAYTLTRSITALGGNTELVVGGWPTMPVEHLRFRGRWTAPAVMQWRATDLLPKLHETRHGAVTEVRFALESPEPPVLPKDAPARFRIGRELHFSSFKSWQQLASQLAPLYLKAATLSGQSPLKAEVERMRAAAPDPAGRALAALRLVQDQVRYVFLGMNDGALVPADADLTWSRRFGDCKGKTALLLALLRALDIAAEPVAVNTLAGDAVKDAPPMIGAFNHVLVRATIDGKDYWLDGAGSGARQLADLVAPPYYWGLPLVARGGDLVEIAPMPLTEPAGDTTFNIDASRGIPGSAALHGELVLRGQAAALMRYGLGSLGGADRDRVMREAWGKILADAKIESVAARFDEDTATEHLTMEGSLPLEWVGERVELKGLELHYTSDLTRPSGPHSDAPFQLQFPTYSRVRETIKLPPTSGSYSIEGEAIRRSIAGVEFVREAHLNGDELIAEASVRSLVPEIPSTGVSEMRKALESVTDTSLYLRTRPGREQVQEPPPGSDKAEEAAAPQDTPPHSIVPAADALGRQATVELNSGKYDAALRDFDRALELDPHLAAAFALRAMAHVWKRQYDQARQDIDAATALELKTYALPLARGLLALRTGRPREAVPDLTAALKLAPNSLSALRWRAEAHWRIGEYQEAIADSTAITNARPRNFGEYYFRALVMRQLGRPEQSLEEAGSALAAGPDSPEAFIIAAAIERAGGQDAQALQTLERSLAVAPTEDTYFTRASYRRKSDVAGRQSDAESILRLNPRAARAVVLLASVQRDAGRYAEAEATLERGISQLGKDPWLLIERGVLYSKITGPQRARDDFAAARRSLKGPQALNEMCWSLATEAVALETALEACDGALAQHPDSASYLDSRGLVLLRLGRYDEAIAAYDAALKQSPNQNTSLYGRGLARRARGDTAAGDADLEAAQKVDASTANEFADYGLTP